jgi:hypothetical protein
MGKEATVIGIRSALDLQMLNAHRPVAYTDDMLGDRVYNATKTYVTKDKIDIQATTPSA